MGILTALPVRTAHKMKTTAGIVAVLAAGSMASHSDWLSWKAKHGVSFVGNEDRVRYGHFLKIKDFVQKHNARYAAGLETYHVSLNKFAHAQRGIRREIPPKVLGHHHQGRPCHRVPVPTDALSRERSPCLALLEGQPGHRSQGPGLVRLMLDIRCRRGHRGCHVRRRHAQL